MLRLCRGGIIVKKAAAIVVLVFAAFFLMVLSAFYGVRGSLNSEHDEEDETTQLTFMNSWGGYDTKAGAIEELLSEFQEQNKDIVVVNQSMSGDDFLPTIKDKFATGDQPDVFGLWPGSDIRSLIAAGKVADLTELINSDPEWKKSFGSDMWPQVEQDGRIYGLPVEIVFEGLFVNNDLFEKYNVEIPKDYDGLVKAIKVFKKNGVIPIAFNCKPEGSYLYQNIAMSLGGKNIESPFKDGEIDECYIKAMYIMRDLYKLGAFPESDECFSMESNTRDDLFLRKKAAMIAQGSWFIEKCTSKDVKLVEFPRMAAYSTDCVVYGLGCGTFYISQKAWNDPVKREKAIKLLRFLTSKEASVKLAQQTDMVSNVDISDYDIEYDELTETGVNLIKNAKILVGPPDSYITRSVWESVIVNNFPDMLTEKISPEELWDIAIKAGAEEK